ncbi:hypothetical protein MRB53_037164 [Persea americana]|nr:hypothetical protein MRB53_037164 [Persea americana]
MINPRLIRCHNVDNADTRAAECREHNHFRSRRAPVASRGRSLARLSSRLADLSATPSSAIADGLRLLERKTSLVCTALKASVYGILLQQQLDSGASDFDGQSQAGG